MEKQKNNLDNTKKINIDDIRQNSENDAMLDILREKDNLIVSVKEASTRRDKLNEKQIRLLSEDNSRKTTHVQQLTNRLGSIEAQLNQKEAEMSLLRVTEGKLSTKTEEFRAGFEKYKAQVRDSLSQIKLSIQEELSKREEYKNQVLDNMKDNYLKMEAQIQEVDNYYKDTIAEISKKQGLSKKYIRHALNDLQEALSLLDISHADFIEPTHIKEEFGKVVEDSSALFQEFKDMKGLPQGGTIIKNIENVNIKLSEAPVIEGLFSEISQITKTTRQSLEKSAKAHLKEGEPQAGAGGAGAGGGQPVQQGEGKASESEKKKGDIGEEARGGEPSEGKKAGDDRIKGDIEEPKKKKFGDEIQEVIFRRGRNYAPFNWREILSDIQLTRFESFIESCIKAEKEGHYMKALGLYKTIKEQPGITDTIAGRLLEDHVEYLEDLIKRKYSFKYKPEESTKTVQTS